MRTEILAITVLALTAALVVYNAPKKSGVRGDLFEAWKIQHGKTYASVEEESVRRSIFNSNLDIINSHNANTEKTFTMAANKFTDLTPEEFGAKFNGYRAAEKKDESRVVILDELDLPTSVDWVSKGAVTAIKNQGDCGSCWSFSTTGSVEGLNFLKTGTLLSFSEQQLMDCSWRYGDQGCNGGLMDNAFRYLETAKNELESAYPYKAKSSFVCKYKASLGKFQVTGYSDVQTNSVQQLMAGVAQQPVSIAVQANQASW